MMPIEFREYQSSDLPILTEIMVNAFDGVSIDQGIQKVYGDINGHDWRWRKAKHFAEDVARDPAGIIVAISTELETNGEPDSNLEILGFISTWMDHDSSIGHIPNISLTPQSRGQGVGRQLIELALKRFREHGLSHAKIETLAQNEIGNHLYRSVGFKEVAQQVHFVADLNAEP
jgi:ribosomal protein S18 acetylase RimI-like enzyme